MSPSSATDDAQIYLITGANRGIGLALTNELATNRPNTIVIAGARDPSNATELKKLAETYPGKIDIVKYVSGDVEGNKALAKEVGDKYGRVDVVVGNAAVTTFVGSTLETSPEVLDEHFRVNVTGVVILYQAFYSLLKASKNPKFIPITSAAASTGAFAANNLGYAAYGASKAALNYVARKLHYEEEWLVSFPLAPGVVVTDASIAHRDLDKTGTVAKLQDPIKMTPEVAGKILVDILVNATREKEGGKFINIDGTEIPW